MLVIHPFKPSLKNQTAQAPLPWILNDPIARSQMSGFIPYLTSIGRVASILWGEGINLQTQ